MIKTASKLGLAMLLFASAFAASAQSGRPLVRLVVPFNPGGGSDLFARVIAPGLSEDMDINCGEILDGTSDIEAMGQRIFERMLAIASGEESKSETLGLGDNEFVPWQIGITG